MLVSLLTLMLTSLYSIKDREKYGTATAHLQGNVSMCLERTSCFIQCPACVLDVSHVWQKGHGSLPAALSWGFALAQTCLICTFWKCLACVLAACECYLGAELYHMKSMNTTCSCHYGNTKIYLWQRAPSQSMSHSEKANRPGRFVFSGV